MSRQPDVPVLARLLDPGVDVEAPATDRRAVRAVVLRDGELLMVLSTRRGDYKFPGGGVGPGETDAAALRREVAEECGARLTGVGAVLGDTLEYRAPRAGRESVLRMVSRYYLCEVAEGLGTQLLDDYEEQLGFEPRWISPDQALAANLAVVRDSSADAGGPPPWTAREIRVLELLRARPPAG